MSTPMAVLGMAPIEVTTDEKTDPQSWSWKPEVQDWDRLTESVKASSNTSKQTIKGQMDHGENK